MNLRARSLSLAVTLLMAGACSAQKGVPAASPVRGDDTVLEKVVVLGRHGVRSPLQTASKLAMYSHAPWPTWDAPPGNLTSHGRQLMTSLGVFYALYYGREGLFPGAGCDRARGTYVWSDTDERDVSTAGGLLAGLFPGCSVAIHRLPGETVDPIVHPLKAHVGLPDKQRAVAEVLGRIGGSGEAVKQAYMPAFLTLDRVLGGCGERNCPGEKSGRQVLFGLENSVEPADDDDHLIRESQGPLAIASTLSEIMLLEYTDGKPMEEVGFGRLSRPELTQILSLHSAYFDLTQETEYPARVGASNLMSHILQTLDASATHVSTVKSFGPPDSRFVYLATHDTNIANVAGFLRIHWLMPGDQADPTPPGGALVFELRKHRADGTEWVRVRFVSQTLDQMHAGETLTLKNPPALLPIYVPGCSVATGEYDCPLTAFRKLVEERTLPEFITP